MSNENQTDSDESLLDPDQSSAGPGVRRVNNKPLIIVGSFMALFLFAMMMVASDRAAQQNMPLQAAEREAVSTKAYADELTNGKTNGIIAASPMAANLEIPDETLGETSLAPPDTNNLSPPNSNNLSPPNSQSANDQFDADMRREEKRRVREIRIQALDAAVRAKSAVNYNQETRGTPNLQSSRASRYQQINETNRDDPTALYQQKLAMINAGLAGNADSGHQTLGAATTLSGSPQFGNNGEQKNRWSLNAKLEAPSSRYLIRPGFIIPAMLSAGINSELPGQIRGQVSENVYDSATGDYLLIPQGSKLVGEYSSDVGFGQTRVLVAWQRITFPDGKVLDIGAMPGADGEGYSGFYDQVDNHFVRTFGSAFLMSGIVAGISLSQPDDNDGSNSSSSSAAISEALGQQLGQVTAQLIAKNMNIAPTLKIRPGYRFNVTVTKDLVFPRPYRAFDYRI